MANGKRERKVRVVTTLDESKLSYWLDGEKLHVDRVLTPKWGSSRSVSEKELGEETLEKLRENCQVAFEQVCEELQGDAGQEWLERVRYQGVYSLERPKEL